MATAALVMSGHDRCADSVSGTFHALYLHDDRLLTLDDTVEFFNLVLGLKLLPEEKKDLVAFLRAL
jgi:hypothetical protein